MKPLKVIVVEDEPLARDLLARWLQDIPDVLLVGEASSINSALVLLQETTPELIFLDINLAGENGFGLIDHLPDDRRPDIVFVTAYSDYAVQAFRVNAVDYLQKPFNKEHLDESIRRARRRQKTKQVNKQQQLDSKTEPRLRVKEGKQVEFVNIASIQWIESAGGYSVLHTDQRCHVMRESLGRLQQTLGDAFVRVHRSTVVNVEYITSIRPLLHGDAMLLLRNDTEIRLSRRYRDALAQLS